MAKKITPLKFKLFSGGQITIHRLQCLTCETKACVRHCSSSTLDPVLKIQNGVPVLADDKIPTEKGWCIECLACEQDCALYGNTAIQIEFKVHTHVYPGQ